LYISIKTFDKITSWLNLLAKYLFEEIAPNGAKGSEGAVRTKPRVSGLKDRAALGLRCKPYSPVRAAERAESTD
jgi:hypothetical protein